MPRVYRTQPEREQFLIRRFIRHLGWRIVRATWPDKPDGLLTLRKGTEAVRVGVEHTEYYIDAPAGEPSRTADLDEFWKVVIGSVTRRISRRPDLRSVYVDVHFRTVPSRPTNRQGHQKAIELARQFAAELVDLVSKRLAAQNSELTISPGQSFPPTCPNLNTLLDRLRITTLPGGPGFLVPRQSWRCSNLTTGHVGFRADRVKSQVEQKTGKAAGYNWGDAEERWLLITASSGTVAQSAGPRLDRSKLITPELRDSCRKSPFDRILFWDYARGWYEDLWSSERVGSRPLV